MALLLTKKQYETMVMLAGHRTTKEIARELGISPSAANQRIASAIRRLGAANRREAARIMLSVDVQMETDG